MPVMFSDRREQVTGEHQALWWTSCKAKIGHVEVRRGNESHKMQFSEIHLHFVELVSPE